MTAVKIIDRLLGLMGSRSAFLKAEWDSINESHDQALDRAFGSMEKAKAESFAKLYEKGQITDKDKMLLVSMLKPKLPRVKRAKDKPIPGTEKWGKK